MKTLEYNRPRLPGWDRFNNWLAIDLERIRTLCARASDNEGVYEPGDVSLFYNGLWMARVVGVHGSAIPRGVFLHVRPTATGKRIQIGLGWKLNGRFTITFRVQSDESAARGTHGPNVGQAVGWERGTA